jgi:hypothetical protein
VNVAALVLDVLCLLKVSLLLTPSSSPVKPTCHSDFPLCVILSTAAGVPFQFTVSCSHGFLASRPLEFPGRIHFQAQHLVLLADFPRRFLLKPVLAAAVSGSALHQIWFLSSFCASPGLGFRFMV